MKSEFASGPWNPEQDDLENKSVFQVESLFRGRLLKPHELCSLEKLRLTGCRAVYAAKRSLLRRKWPEAFPSENQVKTFFAHACAVEKLAAGSAANQTDLATPHQILLGAKSNRYE